MMNYSIIIDDTEIKDVLYDTDNISLLKKLNNIYFLDENIAHCLGCFSCWTRNIGECVIKDSLREISKKIIHSDIFFIITSIKYGSYNIKTKKFMDRFIPNVLPFFYIYKGRVVHIKRYKNIPQIIVLVVENGESISEKETFKKLIEANEYNLCIQNTLVDYCKDVKDIINAINNYLTAGGK